MKSKIRNFIKKVMSIFKIKNIIVFESNADYSDNSRAFYEYLIKNNYNEKYKIYWFVNDKNKFENRKCKNVEFLTMWKNSKKKTIFQWIKYFQIVKNAKFLISSNRQLHKLNDKTISININHGTPLKKVKDLKVVPTDIDLVLVGSDFCIDMMSDQLNLPKEKFICVGNPRNDIIFKNTKTKEKVKEFSEFNKIIVWLPTFRKAEESSRNDSSVNFPLGLPIIYSEEGLLKLKEISKGDKIMDKIYKRLDKLSEDEALSLLYDEKEREEEKKQAEIEYAEEHGLNKGIKQTAKNMLERNMNIDVVAEITGLSLEEVIKLKEDI